MGTPRDTRRHPHTTDTSWSGVSAAHSKRTCGAPPPRSPSFDRCHDLSAPYGHLSWWCPYYRLGTLERPGLLSPGAHSQMEWTRSADNPGWGAARRRVASAGTRGRRGAAGALEGQFWKRVQLQQRACELGDWSQAGDQVSGSGAADSGTTSHRPGGGTWSSRARLLNGSGCVTLCFPSRPRDGTWGFRTRGSSAPLRSRTAFRGTAPGRKSSCSCFLTQRRGVEPDRGAV